MNSPRRISPSANQMTSNYQTIDSKAIIRRNSKALFCVISNLNKKTSGLDGKEVNLLTQVEFLRSGVTLDKLAPLVGITNIK